MRWEFNVLAAITTLRRPEARVGFEGQFDNTAASAGVLKEKRVRNHLEKRIALLSVFSVGLFELMLLFNIMQEPQDAFAASVKGLPVIAINRSSDPDLVSTTSLVSCSPSTSLTSKILPADLGDVRGVQFAADHRLNQIGPCELCLVPRICVKREARPLRQTRPV